MFTNPERDIVLLAHQHFGITLPCSMDDLKKAFRRASKELHPDHSGKDTGHQFAEMRSAYDKIVKIIEGNPQLLSLSKEEFGEMVERETVEGIPLSELGLGLGPTTNGADCPECEHRGYTKSFGHAFRVCQECDEYGYVSETYSCRDCNGTGRFIQRNSRKEVACRVCGGTGKFTHPFRKVRCPKCQGSKTIWTETEKFNAHKCWRCSGTGEIEIFNPLLPKGALRSA